MHFLEQYKIFVILSHFSFWIGKEEAPEFTNGKNILKQWFLNFRNNYMSFSLIWPPLVNNSETGMDNQNIPV